MSFDLSIVTGKKCPYCQGHTVHKEIKKSGYYGMAFCCNSCDAYVECENSDMSKAKGRLANKELRFWRKRAFAYYDPLWLRGMRSGRKKEEVLDSSKKWLSKQMGIEVKFCNINYFDIEQCKKVISICKPHLFKNKK